jgi:hypothetical protein
MADSSETVTRVWGRAVGATAVGTAEREAGVGVASGARDEVNEQPSKPPTIRRLRTKKSNLMLTGIRFMRWQTLLCKV